ncbi:uncharacterized protein LAJ45_05203 [Morchella importuna]|uniref:uncharacterized protein n=1 Tax=Morchella importuna TaxID=1174673 RepID=UPI001E8D3EDA|nr:uncharacterized protein LAJ45_05203 [Morchella importuna]KAH8150508.1 hypothetical protein LAJ45_05203 [Morchella importuna]
MLKTLNRVRVCWTVHMSEYLQNQLRTSPRLELELFHTGSWITNQNSKLTIKMNKELEFVRKLRFFNRDLRACCRRKDKLSPLSRHPLPKTFTSTEIFFLCGLG